MICTIRLLDRPRGCGCSTELQQGQDLGEPPNLEVLFDPSHPDYESLSHWIPKGWGPELFKPEKVRFDNPLKRWQNAFSAADM